MSKPRVVAIIQARLGSKRFPRKVMADLFGRPMIQHVIDRTLAIQGVDHVALNVPLEDYTDIESRIAKRPRLSVTGVQGQEGDVLGSYLTVAEREEADVIIRITGDCPMLAPDLVSRALKAYVSHELGRQYNYLPLCMPYIPIADGWDAEIFSIDLLREAAKHADLTQREHVTTWMRERANACQIRMPSVSDYTALKCSVDTATDLERVRKIMAHMEYQDDYSHHVTWDAWNRAGQP